MGRSGTVWRPYTRSNAVQIQNIMRQQPGPTVYASRRITNPASAFRLFFTEQLMNKIRHCTEVEANRIKPNNSHWKLSSLSFDKFIGVTIARGIFGAKNQPMHSYWETDYGIPIIQRTMSRNVYLEILRFLRFDVKSTRSARLENDKFALCSEMWNMFVENCQRCYNPHEYLTIDEQLLPTKTRCPFRQYMANKPDKFGIKLWMLVDNSSKYFLNGFPYLGRETASMEGQLATRVVMKLIHPYKNGGYNITTDNFFTSLDLAEKLKAINTSLVGTVRLNRRELPPLSALKLPLHESRVLKNEESQASLTIYQCKKKKSVCILSTLHTSGITITTEGKKKPETVLFYNSTKCGVDVLDAMIRQYSTKSASRRWPLAIFYNILDIALINAWILYKETVDAAISRRSFIISLTRALCDTDIGNTQSNDSSSTPVASQSGSRKRQCSGSCNKNRAVGECRKCNKAFCGKCSTKVAKIVEIECNECL